MPLEMNSTSLSAGKISYPGENKGVYFILGLSKKEKLLCAPAYRVLS